MPNLVALFAVLVELLVQRLKPVSDTYYHLMPFYGPYLWQIDIGYDDFIQRRRRVFRRTAGVTTGVVHVNG